MALPKITHGEDDYEFIRLEGEPSRFGENVEVLTRPGYPGIALRRLGQRPNLGQRPWIAVADASSAAALKALEETIMALQGAVVSVTNNAGAVYADMAIISVELIGAMQRHRCVVGGVQSSSDRFLRKFGILMVPTTLPT
jgi:hypothetical protein